MAKALVKEGVGVFCDIQLKNNCSVNDSIKYIVSSDGSEDEGKERERESFKDFSLFVARSWVDQVSSGRIRLFFSFFFPQKKTLIRGCRNTRSRSKLVSQLQIRKQKSWGGIS